MIINTDPFSLDLPLSWTRSATNSLQKKVMSFKISKMHWISLAHLPENQNLKQSINQLHKKYPKGILLRGCSAAIADQLRKKKFEVLPIGQEAIIDLNKPVFKTRNLRQSARSGNRHNSIRKIGLNYENREKLKQLKKNSRHGQKPQLKNLFIDTFNKHTECFIAEDKKGWNAAITFSRVHQHKVQAELLLRKPCAASGTMEALIEQVFIYVKEKGYHYFSLGEVPFEVHNFYNSSFKSRLLCKIGKTMRFAYNSATLYKFKNKFSPTWKPVYLCGSPKISILTIFEMSLRCNYLKLLLHAAFLKSIKYF